MNYIEQYYDAIEKGIVIVPKYIKKVYQKIVESINNPDHYYYYDKDKSNKAIEFIEKFCKQSQGVIGAPIELMLWQKALICVIFGIINKKTGYRQFKEAFVLVARKNGKSTLLSAIAIYMLIADKEGGAEIYSVATKLEQSKRIVTEAWNMIRQSQALREVLKKRRNDIYFEMTRSVMMALASSSKSMDGLNTHLAVVDEAHAIRDRNLYEVMKQSMQTRRQPLLFVITTAGTVRENIYDSLYEYAVKVAEGEIEDQNFLPILYELDSADEWTDPTMWQKANPGLGIIKLLSALEDEVDRARKDPDYLTGVLCKHFNIRQTGNNRWLTFDDVNNKETYTPEEIKDMYCIAGVDLSSTTDLTCATILTKKKLKRTTLIDGVEVEKEIPTILIKQMYWMPREKMLLRMSEDKVPYDKWVEKGLLRLCDGNAVEYHSITEWFVEQLHDEGLRPLWVGYDSWSANYWKDEMESYGFDMVEVRQGAKTMSQPMKQLEADLKDKKINYNNNPILKWCLTNTTVKSDDNGNIRPLKGNGNRQRIDGTVSLIDAYVIFYNNYQEFANMVGE